MKKVLLIVFSVLLLISGIVMIAHPGVVFLALGYMVPFMFLINGIANVILWFKLRKYQEVSIWQLIASILAIVLGILILTNQFAQLFVDGFLVYMVVFWFFIAGIVRIVEAFSIKKLHKEIGLEAGKNWWVLLIIGILFIVCAILSFINPISLALGIGFFVGINTICSAIDLMTFAFIVPID